MKLGLITLFTVMFWQGPLWATELDFSNDREGKSSYVSNFNKFKEKSILKRKDSLTIQRSFDEATNQFNDNNICAFNLIDTFQSNLGLKRISKGQFQGAVYHLRFTDKIDDVVTQILLNAYDVENSFVGKTSNDEVFHLVGSRESREKMYQKMSSFNSEYMARNCYDDAYRNLHADLYKIEKFSNEELAYLFEDAFDQKIIDRQTYDLLQKARVNELNLKVITLKDYFQKRSSLRIQYPLSDTDEVSEFVTLKNSNGVSHRQQLLAGYNDFQIIIMGNIVKKLRARLESDRIEIMVYDSLGNPEIIPLDPMERFRFSLKLLRKEMLNLSLNAQFNGRAPSYMDLIAASFETGIIAGSELDELANLEEIWNPKKTLWDKASFWVRTFSSVATIMIPPPYGFVPVLALIAIEATVGKKEQAIDDGSLF